MKHLKTHKYPFNLLKVIYGDIISRDILSSLKSNPLTEQIFEIITYPYLSAYQREYLRDFYQDFLTIQEISEKDKRDKAFVEDSINCWEIRESFFIHRIIPKITIMKMDF